MSDDTLNINSLTDQFKTYDELKIFCSSQFKQILQLSKRIKELDEKNQELNKKVKQNNNLSIISGSKDVVPSSGLIVQGDAQTIAQVQLKTLKELAFDRELTLEEAKKVDIYNKILISEIDEKPKTFKADAKILKSDELINLLEDASGSK